MQEEKRMIENYEVRQSFMLGDREIVLAIDKDAEMPYLLTDCRATAFGKTQFENSVVSDDYLELVDEFTQRLTKQMEQIKQARQSLGVSHLPLSSAQCVSRGVSENIEGRVVIVKASAIRPDLATADHQLVLATGGNGCRPNARGTAVFCTNLSTGEHGRWERYDIEGVADVEQLPQWAKDAATRLQNKAKAKEQER